MPNHKSAAKRDRQNKNRRLRNRYQRTTLRSVCKAVDKAVAEGNAELATQKLIEATRLLDRAASKGLTHKNTAARKKSRLTSKIKKLKAPAENA